MTKAQLCQRIEKERLIAIVRKVYGDDLLFLADALIDAGISTLEVTFDQQDPDCLSKTSGAIRAVLAAYGERCACGAGTVLTLAQADAAAEAGASLIISPNCNEHVIRHTCKLGLVSIPGCMTPSEILAAHDAGADFVKIFPAGSLGPGYIKNISAPVSHVKFLAVGGVDAENYGAFLKAGCVGAGIGGSLTNRALIAARNREQLMQNAAQYVSIARAFDKGENV
ncbi:MAG: bifunctional 4-hydroxy-2-oxoglutarate aldolase/2-dehydro-3-deoxy-phosphogluconate aldolase [Clostridiaceae bacterium]